MNNADTAPWGAPDNTARQPLGWALLIIFMATLALGWSATANAYRFKIPFFGDQIRVNAKTRLTAGFGIRTEAPETSRIAKNHLNPNVCGRNPANGNTYYQSCQGLMTDQGWITQHLYQAPGQYSDNFDQGELNYNQWDITTATFRVDEYITAHFKGWKLYVSLMGFYDPVNNDFTTYNPNLITAKNFDRAGNISTTDTEVLSLSALTGIPNLSQLTGLLNGLGGALQPVLGGLPLGGALGTVLTGGALAGFQVRNDGRPCGDRNPNPGAPCGIVYGHGLPVHRKRTDSRTLHEVGRAINLININLSGRVHLPFLPQPVNLKIGRQSIVWGGATLEFFDSINVFNPPNLNNFFRIGGNGLDDFYQPLNAISFGYQATPNFNISGWYQLQWEPLYLPAAGSFYSPVNIDTKNGGQDYLTAGFGNTVQDETGRAFPLDNPLSLLTATSSRIGRLRDENPHDWNQFGVKLDYYATWLNNGTDISFYFANYTSRVPFFSFWSSDEACSKHSKTSVDIATQCSNTPLLRALLKETNHPERARDEYYDAHAGSPGDRASQIVSFDTIKFQLQYPSSIQMYGLSFNTTVGRFALQGGVAFRPKDPLQVDLVDLAFAALGPSLTTCNDGGCQGTPFSEGVNPDGSFGEHPSSDYPFTKPDGTQVNANTINLIIGGEPDSQRAFPNLIIPYRGDYELGRNPANSYIRGWEYFKTLSFDFGATYISGPSDFLPKLLHADQIVWLFEVGARGILDLPSIDQLALAVPGTYTSPTAGADGSGADGGRLACSTNPACVVGPDGLRFNPHQAPTGLYPDAWSGGYGAVILFRWDSLLQNFTIDPQLIFKHDVFGRSPGYLSNYVKGRILFIPTIAVSYRSVWQFKFRYRMWAGGGQSNLFKDRDEASFFVQYSF